jgi:hypothetical protein
MVLVDCSNLIPPQIFFEIRMWNTPGNLATASSLHIFLPLTFVQAMQQLSQCLDPKLLAQFGGKKGYALNEYLLQNSRGLMLLRAVWSR